MTKNVFIPTTKGLVSATKVQTFSTEEKTQATSNIAAASVNGTYANPAWITALAASKITGTFMKAQQHAQTAYKDEANTWAETQLFQKPITVQDGGGNNVFDVTTNQIRFRSASAGYLLGPSGQCVAGEDSGGFYLAGGFTTPTKAIYIGQQLTTQIIAAAQTINNRTSEFNVIGVDGTGWGAFRAGQATFNGFLTITKTGSNGLIVNNTVGNALAIFNASAASVTDNAYWTIQTAGSDRWYVGQSVSGLTGNFEIYGTAFGGSMLTLNRTTGAMTANAATFNGLVAAPNNTLIGNSDGTSILGGLTYFRPAAGGSSGALITGTGQAWVSTLSVGGGLETTPPTNGLLVQGAATFNGAATYGGIESSDAFRHRNSAGEFPWMLYSPGTDMSWYVRDMVNARMQMTFNPGASASAALTQIHSQLTVEGAATLSGIAKLGDFTVGTLPSAVANAGYECNVTDSSVTTFGSTVAGGGSSRVKLYSNGTNWTVQAA